MGTNTKNRKERVLKSSLPRSPNRMRTAVRAMENESNSHAFSSLRSMANRLFYNNVIGMLPRESSLYSGYTSKRWLLRTSARISRLSRSRYGWRDIPPRRNGVEKLELFIDFRDQYAVAFEHPPFQRMCEALADGHRRRTGKRFHRGSSSPSAVEDLARAFAPSPE